LSRRSLGTPMEYTENDISTILSALKLSAERHRNQRRKDAECTPYINHPVEVAELLWRVGNVRDTRVIVAALLHDIIEDTNSRPEEIRDLFGETVLTLVLEVTDDKSQSRMDRKRRQIEHARQLSHDAKQIKLADKICNVFDLANSPPKDWEVERKREYLDWSKKVVEGLRGCNPRLESYYDQVLANSFRTLLSQS
jgi:guanosine-3',5'-bis(diphosphate) 3'-pyrophosphohydrolase